MKMLINGIVFDADGTLLDSMRIWRNLGVEFLLSNGIQPEEKLSEKLYVMSFEQGIEYLKKNYDLKYSSDEIKNGILEIISDFYINKVQLKPNTKIFLEKIISELKIPMVIATAGDKNLLEAALLRLGISDYFRKIFTCTELNTTKHESKIFIECAKFMNSKPENILVFEDAFFALDTAKKAGFLIAGVEDDSSISSREQIKNISDFYIEKFDFDSLKNFLKG